jgi:Sugar phosphate isomerases/epimerases
MKNILSCSSHSYSKFSFDRALKGIAESGLKYVEIASIPGHSEHVRPETMTKNEMKEIGKFIEGFGLKATSISGHSNMASAEGTELFKKRLDLADVLGIPFVNTAEGSVKSEEDKINFFKHMREAADYAKSRKIIICLETHGGMLGTSEDCQKTLEIIGRDNVKINYDPANLIYFEGKSPEDDINKAVANIGHFHIKDKLEGKDVWNFPAIGTGYINFEKLFTVLKDAAYQGPLSFELEFIPQGLDTPEEVDEALAYSVKTVRNIIDKINW